MAILVNRYNAAHHATLLADMHRARKKVFVDLLGWHVHHDGTEERDTFDDEEAAYLIVRDPRSGGRLASVRLLRSDRPHLLGALFPSLFDGPVPSGADVREITRFCLAPAVLAFENILRRHAIALFEPETFVSIRTIKNVSRFSASIIAPCQRRLKRIGQLKAAVGHRQATQ